MENKIWLTGSALEQAERKVPIFAIYESLTDDQRAFVKDNIIPVSKLTSQQIMQAQDAIDFDSHLCKTWMITCSQVNSIVNRSL